VGREFEARGPIEVGVAAATRSAAPEVAGVRWLEGESVEPDPTAALGGGELASVEGL